MKLKLLIATADSDYAEHLSNNLSGKYSDTFEVSVCSSAERLRDLLAVNRYDTILLEPSFTSSVNADSAHLQLVLMDESGFDDDSNNHLKRIHKYRRISSIVGNILENYAESSNSIGNFVTNTARVTAVWSPSGGTGKTTVALAYAAHKISNGKQAVYLNLENFSSTSAYFQEDGKSISKVFEKLDSNVANVHMLLLGIRQQDISSGITYFCGPENYEDINILTASDIETLVNACAIEADELVIDLASQYDERVKKIFEMANTVLIICAPSSTSQVKLKQFLNQHNVFGQIQVKTVFVNNKCTNIADADANQTIHLPRVQSSDPISIFKTLSSSKFDW